jgi:hypothetical protein
MQKIIIRKIFARQSHSAPVALHPSVDRLIYGICLEAGKVVIVHLQKCARQYNTDTNGSTQSARQNQVESIYFVIEIAGIFMNGVMRHVADDHIRAGMKSRRFDRI